MALSRPRDSTVRRLYALSMNRCAYPDCPTLLVPPDTESNVGQVCHIKGKSAGGPRYDESQTDEDRHGFANLILMCGVHHKMIDADVQRHTVEWLLEIKRTHEDRGRASGEIDAPADVVAALMISTTLYEAGAIHNDFRDAVFKVGGEGGQFGGGGGGGGQLIIMGVTHLPPDIEREVQIDLAGGPGLFPGSGGGGAGVLVFEGRAVVAPDIEAGLSVPVMFPANSIAMSNNGLLDVLGAAWEHYWVNEFPSRAHVNVAFTVEFGTIAPNTLLGFNFTVTNGSGVVCGQGTVDVEVPTPEGVLVNRRCGLTGFSFDAGGPGMYELTMLSGGTRFARYTFEVRRR